MTIRTDGEKVAILEEQMKDIKEDISEIKTDIKLIKDGMITAANFDSRLKKIEDSSGLWRWLSPTLAAVMGSILTFLIIEFLRTR